MQEVIDQWDLGSVHKKGTCVWPGGLRSMCYDDTTL